jgi:hypothetical protein
MKCRKRPDEEIKSRLNSKNACYHLVQNILSARLLSKNLKIKTWNSIILPVALYGCETWSLTPREEQRLWVFWNRVLRVSGPKWKWWEAGKDCIMRSFVTCTVHHIPLW